MTMLVDAVVARISDLVAALSGRVEVVADLSAQVEQGVLPQADTAAYVIPLGFDDLDGGSSIAGAHIQNISDAIGVVLFVKSPGDAKARRGIPKIDVLGKDVINAVAGWTPENTPGVFSVVRGRLVSVNAGAIFYQLDFKLNRQLRIM